MATTNRRTAAISAAMLALVASVTSLLAQSPAGVISGPVGPSPYDIVRGWHKPNSEPGFTFGGNSGVFAESPNRLFVLQRGEYKLPNPVPPTFAGFAGSIGVNVLSATAGRVWKNCLYTLDANGNVKERWTQWDSLCEGSSGPGPHRLRISPYDPEHRVWVVNETFSTIYIFSNDGSKLLKTLGEKNVQGTDGKHFGKPQDVAFLPDGRILIADGLDNHRVMILDKEMNYISEFGGPGKGPGQFSGVHAIAVGPEGRIFALDRSGNRINVFKTTADPAKVEFVEAFPGFSLPLDLIVNDDSLWMTDLSPLRFTKLDFHGNHLYTWMVPKDLPDGYLEVHTFTVDSNGILYGGDNQYGRTQKFVPKPGADPKLLIRAPWVGRASVAENSCESLLKLIPEHATVTLAEIVGAGAFRTGAAQDASRFANLPAFCRVAATLKPSADSDIKIEVWMPASGWNGKFEAVGNGGWAGTISYPAMAQALARGYATTSTDTGHSTPGGSFALGHPEKLIDFAYRSEHEMTVKAKAIINAFYGSAPARSYFNGCSTGGRQALTEATKFPDDFDGIVAGAAANPKTRLDTWRIWMGLETLKDPATRIPKEKYPAIHAAVLAACDGLDGLKDGLIDDPTRCHFDPQVLACKDADGPGCLTPKQVQSVKTILGPARSPRTGAEIFPGYQPGTELLWGQLLGGLEPYATALDQFRYTVFNDPQWDWRTFDVDRDLAKAEDVLRGILTALDPNISAFVGHGGKLLTYHGWSDQDIAPLASVNFYTSAAKAIGDAKAASSLRLFMAPGMGHCGGGEGPNTFDMMAPLEQWVEKGQAPTRIVASHRANGNVDRTRPLCAYPQVARYAGNGSIDDAANFICRLP